MAAAGSSPSVTAAIVGVAGCTLDEDERRLIQGGNPWGFILFARNCASPAQVRSLVDDLRAAVGRPDAPVLIDQEGGRVARLCPPHWPARPPARRLGLLAERDPAGRRRGGVAARQADRRRSGAARDQRGLRAGARSGAARPHPGDRRSRPCRRSATGRAARAGHDRRVSRRRRPAGHQAPARSRARAPRQPPVSADRHRHGREDGGRRLDPVSRLPGGAVRDDRARALSGARYGVPRHHVAEHHRDGDPRRDRLCRRPAQRRSEHARALRLALGAQRGGARRRLRYRAALQRRS